jgi:hypothetical protein
MAISYPSNPVSGDTFTDEGITYTWSGVSWVYSVTNTPSGNQGPQGETGATGPEGPQGPQGDTGVVTATAPITYDSGTQTVAIDQAGITLAQAQVTGLSTSLTGKANISGGNAFTGSQTITGTGAANKPLIVKGATSQTANLQDWQNSAATTLAKVDSFGRATFPGITSTTYQDTALTINNVDARGIVINSEIDGEYYSSYDIIQANVYGTRTFAIDSAGNAFFGGGQGVQTNAVASPTTYLSLTSSSNSGINIDNAATVGLNNGGNVSFFPYTSTNYQSGNRILFIGNRLTEPTGSPVSGGFMYVDAGALKYRGTSGSAATIVNANGTQTAPSAAIRVAANRTTTAGGSALAANAQETAVTVTYPSSRFTTTPSVVAATSSVRYVAAITSSSSTGFTMIVRNVSDGTGTTYTWNYQAIEIVAGMGN